MFTNVETRTQLLITHIFDASRKTSMPINLITARRQAHWTKLYAGGLFSVRQNDVRANYILGKRRSAERRFGKMTFGSTTIRKTVVRHYEVSLIRRFGHVTLRSNDFRQFFVSAKQRFGKIAFRQNDDSTKEVSLFWVIFSSFQCNYLGNYCSNRFWFLFLNFVNSSSKNLSVKVFPIQNFPRHFHHQNARKRNACTTCLYNKK